MSEDRIMSRVANLDALTGGLQKGQIIAIGGRTCTGKTSLALNIAYNIAIEDDIPCAIFSLRSDAERIDGRLLAKMPEWDYRRYKKAPLRIIVTPPFFDLPLLETKVRSAVRKKGVKIIIIDDAQLVYAANEAASNMPRYRWVAKSDNVIAVLTAIKKMAEDLSVPIVAFYHVHDTEQEEYIRGALHFTHFYWMEEIMWYSLDGMFKEDIKALVSRWEEDAARLVDKYLDEDRANGINTIEDYKKRYDAQRHLNKADRHNQDNDSGNAEIVPTGSQKAALLLMAIEREFSSCILEHLDDNRKNILTFEIERMDERVTNLKGSIIDELRSLLKVQGIIELVNTKGDFADERDYLWERMKYLCTEIGEVYHSGHWNYEHVVSEAHT